MRRILWLLLLLIAFPASAQDAPTVTLSVDAADALHDISPYVYGVNYGPYQVITADIIDEVQQGGFTMVRFPAGRWGDENFIRESNLNLLKFGTDLMGIDTSDIIISANLELGTPDDAVELMQLVNEELGWGVRYWSVGNEPNLFDDYDTVTFNREWREIAEAMKAYDSDIMLVGPDISQFTGTPDGDQYDAEGRHWVREFLRENGDLIDIVAVHRYPFPRSMSGEMTTVDELRTDALRWDEIPQNLKDIIAEETGRELPIAFTEINSHWSASMGGEASPDSHYNAVWWAHVLGKLIAADTEIVTYFDVQSNPSRGGLGLLGRSEPRPTYYVYQLYQNFGETLVSASSSDEFVSVYAATTADGALTLIIVNLADEAHSATLEIAGNDATSAQRTLLDEAHFAETMDDAALDAPLTLPPRSVTLLRVE